MTSYRIRLTAVTLLMAAIFICAGCAKEDDLIDRYVTIMGNVHDGKVISDQGVLLDIQEQQCEGDLDTMKRVYMMCDILHEVPGQDNEYAIRTYMLENVKVQDVLQIPFHEIPSEVGSDPIMLEEGWFSGGYLNVIVGYAVRKGSGVRHSVELVFDPASSNSDLLIFTLRHNAGTDQVTVPPEPAGPGNAAVSTDIRYVTRVISFPLAEIVRKYSDKTQQYIPVNISQTWYKDNTMQETEEKIVRGKYFLGQYEQSQVIR